MLLELWLNIARKIELGKVSFITANYTRFNPRKTSKKRENKPSKYRQQAISDLSSCWTKMLNKNKCPKKQLETNK